MKRIRLILGWPFIFVGLVLGLCGVAFATLGGLITGDLGPDIFKAEPEDVPLDYPGTSS